MYVKENENKILVTTIADFLSKFSRVVGKVQPFEWHCTKQHTEKRKTVPESRVSFNFCIKTRGLFATVAVLQLSHSLKSIIVAIKISHPQ